MLGPSSRDLADLLAERGVEVDHVPAARHVLEQYTNNRVESDHGRLKARLRPMRGLKIIRSLRTIAAGHAFVRNLHRGHYELSVDLPADDRVVHVAFGSLPPICSSARHAWPRGPAVPDQSRQQRVTYRVGGGSAASNDLPGALRLEPR